MAVTHRRAAVLAVLATGAVAFDAYRALVPNGQSVPGSAAVGHRITTGGGPLSAFGRDFNRLGKVWSRELCELDSDGDGLTNGDELGDPCCCWNAEMEWNVLLAVHDLGHRHAIDLWNLAVQLPHAEPGKPWDAEAEAPKAAAAPKKNFFRRGTVCSNPGDADERLNFTLATGGARPIDCSELAHCPTQEALLLAADSKSPGGIPPWWMPDTPPPEKLVPTIFVFIGTAIILSPSMGVVKYARESLGLRGGLALWFGIMLWMDLTGCLLHLVLDNPINLKHAALRSGVQSFINHHADPQKIAVGELIRYCATHMPVAALAMWSCLLYMGGRAAWERRRDRRDAAKGHQRPSGAGAASGPERIAAPLLFLVIATACSIVMQLGHRWSHTPPYGTPAFALFLQNAGFLIAPRVHAGHHVAPYGHNFSIMMGWADKLVNPVLYTVAHARHPVWIYVFICWLFTPVIFTSVRYMAKVGRAWDHACRRVSAACAPPSAPGAVARDSEAACAAPSEAAALAPFERLRGTAILACTCLVGGSCSHYFSSGGTFWQKAFVLHPIFMGVGCVGLMTEGILAPRRQRAKSAACGFGDDAHEGLEARRSHRNINMLASALCLFGLLVAMRVRLARGVPAIAPIGLVQNPHATIGFAALGGIALQILMGIVKGVSKARIFNDTAVGRFFEAALKWHGTIGKVVYALALLSAVIGVAHIHSASLLIDLSVYITVVLIFGMWAMLGSPGKTTAAESSKLAEVGL